MFLTKSTFGKTIMKMIDRYLACGLISLCFAATFSLSGCTENTTPEPPQQNAAQSEATPPVAPAMPTDAFSHALDQAMLDENEPLAIELVQQGASITALNEQGVTVLHLASRATMPELVALLIDKGADVHARIPTGDTPIHWAARAGASDRDNAEATILVLLEHGADINARNNRGDRPIDYAIRTNNQAWLSVMRSHGATLD
jgi:ankyrin repeat protein